LDVYIHSNHLNQGETFADLGLHDFFVAHHQVAHRHLKRLDLDPLNVELLSRGSLPQLKCREPYERVLEASIGYAASCSVAVMDEVAIVNKRTMEVNERVVEMNRRVGTLLDGVWRDSWSLILSCLTGCWGR
jgi:hypothetical protein